MTMDEAIRWRNEFYKAPKQSFRELTAWAMLYNAYAEFVDAPPKDRQSDWNIINGAVTANIGHMEDWHGWRRP